MTNVTVEMCIISIIVAALPTPGTSLRASSLATGVTAVAARGYTVWVETGCSGGVSEGDGPVTVGSASGRMYTTSTAGVASAVTSPPGGTSVSTVVTVVVVVTGRRMVLLDFLRLCLILSVCMCRVLRLLMWFGVVVRICRRCRS